MDYFKEPEKMKRRLETILPGQFRKIFPTYVNIVEPGILNVRIILIDEDVEVDQLVDLPIDSNGCVDIVYAVEAIAKVWEMRHHYKKILLTQKRKKWDDQ